MEHALPKYGESPRFSKVNKKLRGENGITIGVAHENTLLDTRIYNFEYMNDHKSALSANKIATNMSSQVEK